jgi:hypothetical protein
MNEIKETSKILFSSNAAIVKTIQTNLKPIPATSKKEVINLSTYKEKGRIIDIKA